MALYLHFPTRLEGVALKQYKGKFTSTVEVILETGLLKDLH
jgi:hypothetical protein